MREIKFRAWIPQDKKMFQVGNLVIPRGLNEMGDQELGVAETYSIIKPHHYIQPILMQYTGLKDKNGKEIYEGDIIQQISAGAKNPLWEVVWHENAWCIRLITREPLYYVRLSGKLIAEWDEVIGSIYENPELLTPTK